jgi:hypothetical protein
MNKIDSINTQYKESTFKIAHPAIGDLYCGNVMEAQGILHEICEDKLYFQSGISVSPGDSDPRIYRKCRRFACADRV